MEYLISVLAVVFVTIWYSRVRGKKTLAGVPGPVPSSFVLGNFSEYYQDEVGEHEFAWQEQYGPVYRIKGLFGEDRLMVSDPKSLQYIYQNIDRNWPKPTTRREFGRMLMGRGIAWAEGNNHKRQRKILTPAFGNIESREMMPVIRSVAQRMCQHWRSLLRTPPSSSRIEVSEWLSRATLDTIGEAAFSYQFGSMENQQNRLAQSYGNLIMDTFNLPTCRQIFGQHLLSYLPMWVFRVVEHLPLRNMRRLRMVAQEGSRVARELIDSKLTAADAGSQTRQGRNFMDLLARANMSEDPRNRLSEEELLAQMRTIITAGHLTTGNTLCFILYELARHPDVQEKVRSEIDMMLAAVHERGKMDYNMSDLDGMHFVLAVLKEVMRLHPVIYDRTLLAKADDILPLSKPIMMTNGKMLSELPVRAGQCVHVSIAGYNRLKDVWGSDAHAFRPGRWLDGSVTTRSNFGVFGNLANFAGGSVSCLGWRFAVIEMETFMVEILRNFHISLPEEKILRASSGIMSPMLASSPEKGMQLPLIISSLL